MAGATFIEQKADRQRLALNLMTWTLLAIGVGTRLAQYLYNRPLWGDELALIDNLTHRSFVGLLAPLDLNQAAPVGFLWLEKLALTLLGPSPYTFRLVPLIAGIAAIFVFWLLVRRVAPAAVPIALGLFVSSNWLIYYAAETKQYSLDLLISLALTLLFVTKPRPLWLLLAGVVAVWFSHPVVFVLAGIGLAWLLKAENRLPVLAVGAAWLLSFALAYLLIYRQTAGNTFLLQYWSTVEPGFVRLEPVSIFRVAVETIALVSGWKRPILFILVLAGMAIGIKAMKSEPLLLFFTPLLLALVAAGLEMYPYVGRFILFAVPGLTILTALGLSEIIHKLTPGKPGVRVALTLALLLAMMVQIDVTQPSLFG